VTRWLRNGGLVLLVSALAPGLSAAQEPPPKIGPFALDLHGTVPRFPTTDAQLAQSRGLDLRDLPGMGLGAHAALHVYPLRWKVVTFGLGVDATYARARRASRQYSAGDFSRGVTERFVHAAPELSFNFGTGNGWSYISGGIGPGLWSLDAGEGATIANTERLQTINYGGGARWFNTKHLAFSFDVRFYAVNPGTGELGRPGGPRTRLLFMGAGISIK
jgi:hypothetical protein